MPPGCLFGIPPDRHHHQRTGISGAHQPTQRIEIVSDVEATPTIEGIRVGRDEVLESARRSPAQRTPVLVLRQQSCEVYACIGDTTPSR